MEEVMQVGISSHTYDLEGSFLLEILPGQSKLTDFERRVERTATLDGGAAVNDGGFSHGDRTIILACEPGEETAEALQQFFQDYANCVLTLSDGCFDAYFQDLTNDFGVITITLLIKEELS
jgi:hypothetical protein